MRAAIVGLGAIGAQLDSPESRNITTHAHAYMAHKQTTLVSVCDSSKTQRETFSKKWGSDIATYEDLATMLESEAIEILSIATPTHLHVDALHLALQSSSITHILCEKPFVASKEQLQQITQQLQQSDKKLSINFIRHYDSAILHVKKSLLTLGNVVHFQGNFTKGLYHNGSHMLELIEHLLGDIHSIKANHLTCKDDDIYGTFFIQTSDTHGTINNFSGDNFALFELDIYCKKGRIRIQNSGHSITIEEPVASSIYPNYYHLHPSKSITESLSKALYNSVDTLINHYDATTTQSHLKLSEKLLDIKERLCKETYLEFR